jgi:7-carboxy-7-deazaguanine synthase
MEKTYAVKEMFKTVQGEGHHVGTPAFFVRLAGCNMWSGHEETRERDAVRNDAKCPRWCDTDFVGGDHLTAREIAETIPVGTNMIVVTGGEPLLQVDQRFVDVLSARIPTGVLAFETNGTVVPRFVRRTTDNARVWMTCSPKQPPEQIRMRAANEIKLVWPDHDPMDWEWFIADHYYLSPRADQRILNQDNQEKLAQWVAGQNKWKLSLQTHKITGLR